MAPSPHLFLAVVVAASAAAAAFPGAAAAQNLTEAEALVQLKKSFTNSSSLSSWLITNNDTDKQSPCAPGSHEWHGVVCRRGVVSGLRLSALELGGTIDVDALAAFHHLRSVSFAHNNFSGPLPAFYQLTALKSMYLSNNQFNGSIPDDFFANLSHLKKLWLNGNNLSGPIPPSIAKATSLLELHLDNNDLTGQLPPQPPPALRSFNVSGNDLDGVVPEAFRKFDAGRFEGNAYLCYVPTDTKPCVRVPDESSTTKRIAMVLATVFVSAVVLAVALRLWAGRGRSQSARARDMDSAVPHGGSSGGKTRHDASEKPPVYMADQASPSVPHKRSGSTSWLTRRAGSSIFGHRSSASTDLGGSAAGGDLVVVNECKGVFRLADLMKAAAEVIGSGGLGSAYKAVMANGVAVVVKRARDMNRVPTKDAFDAEMKRLGAIRHANLLPPLAYHYRSDEKLIVYEYIPKGSLLYVLHGDRGMDYAALDWPARLKVAAGVARGAAFLHTALAATHEVPHGNLKSANVLLAPDFEPLLVDFGFSGLISQTQSPYAMFSYRAPECVAGQPVTAKADVYCLGIVLLELLTGKFPSQYLNNAKGGTDLVMWATSAMADGFGRDLFDPAIMAKWKFAVPDMTRLLQVAVDCVETELEKRPSMKEAAARVEEAVVTALATVRDRPEEPGGMRPGDAGSRSSHTSYVREGSIQRTRSVGERSLSRRGSGDYSYGIS